MVWGAIFPVKASEHDAKARELEALRTRIEHLQGELAQDLRERSTVQLEVEEADRAIGRLAARLGGLAEQRARSRDRLAGLNRRRAGLRHERREERAALGAQLRSAFVAGRAESLKVLLNQEDPHRLGRMLVYHDYFTRSRRERIRELSRNLADLAEVERDIEQESRRLSDLEAALVAEQAALTDQRRQRAGILDRLNAEINSKDARLKAMQADEHRIGRVVERLREITADLNLEVGQQVPIPELRGRLPWPARGRLAARYGSSRGVGSLRWNGLVIEAAEGEPVRAVHRGRVAFADWLRGFGLLLIIDHGDGFLSLYGYNQTLLKETGEWVEAGEPIATVGQSGGRGRSGLYFELRRNGKPANPASWLAKR